MLRAGMAMTAAGAAAGALDPAGLGWLGWTAAGLGLVVALYGLARQARRRSFSRTLESLRALPPGAFEERVAAWLRRGRWEVEVVGGPGDGGVDLLARKGSSVAAVQCKRLAGDAAVSAGVVRELYGAAVAARATLAVLVTTGRVSPAARQWAAERDGEPRLVLIDGEAAAAAARTGRLRL